MAHAPKAPPDGLPDDFTAELRAWLPREAGEIVRCTRVDDHHYRCNWWRSAFNDGLDNPGVKGSQLATTYRVFRSAFVEVYRVGERLRVEEVHPRGKRFGYRLLSE